MRRWLRRPNQKEGRAHGLVNASNGNYACTTAPILLGSRAPKIDTSCREKYGTDVPMLHPQRTGGQPQHISHVELQSVAAFAGETGKMYKYAMYRGRLWSMRRIPVMICLPLKEELSRTTSSVSLRCSECKLFTQFRSCFGTFVNKWWLYVQGSSSQWV